MVLDRLLLREVEDPLFYGVPHLTKRRRQGERLGDGVEAEKGGDLNSGGFYGLRGIA
jgi:hypothetical protein